MSELPPLLRDQRKADAEHLKLLAIFHCVVAGLAVIGIGFLLLHYLFLHELIENPELWKNHKGGGPAPDVVFGIFKWIYVVVGSVLLTGGIANLISGWCIWKRKGRVFSLIVAGLNCIHFPFGTVLGVFTLVVLLRDSVREVYEA